MALDVFISYSPKDRALRDELGTHLSNLQRQGQISAWYDDDIAPGADRKAAIQANLSKAHLILLLISADFIASDFCYSIEMQQALARHQANHARVIPIILRPTDWEGAPFAHLQALPANCNPVTEWPSHDSAFKDVVKGLRAVVEEWQARIPPNPLSTHQIELPQVDDILAGQIAASTRAMYRRDIAAYVKFARKEGLAEDNSKTLDAWRDYLVSGYVQRNGKQLSPNSINRMLAPLRKLFKEAARLDMVKGEVAAKFKAVPGVKKKALKERLKSHSRTRISPEDMRRLCESPSTDTRVGLRDRALLATLASSGVRASELTSLTLDQIIKKDGGYQLSVRGKTDTDYRDAAISPEAYQLIQAWLQARSCASMYVFTAFAGRGDRQLDTPITESGLWKLIVKYAKKCGIPWVKPHDIRRFVGTQLAADDLRKAQIALGHKNISSTARHYVLEELQVGITDNLY